MTKAKVTKAKDPPLYVCEGSKCRKALANDGRLLEVAADLPVRVVRVRCQKVCKSPVCGLDVDGELAWFARMDSGKALRALRELVLEGGRPGKPLRKRRADERDGRLRS